MNHIFLVRGCCDIRLGQDELALHATRCANVEIPRPMVVIVPLVIAKAVLSHVFAHRCWHPGVGFQKPKQAMRVIAVFLVDGFSLLERCFRPRCLLARHAQRNDRVLPVVELTLVVGHPIQTEDLIYPVDFTRVKTPYQQFVLPGIMPGKPPEEFSASQVPLCYNVRLNLSLDPANQVPIEKPEGYDPGQYELLVGSFHSGEINRINQILGLYRMPDNKRELNNRQYSIVSLSMPGEQTPWAEASFEEREAIHKKYRNYTHGLLWFLKSDPRVPAAMREDMAQYGFCNDEWNDNNHWPWYLYIRAARRMQGEFILTQADVTTTTDKEDVIHIGSHYIDAHHVTRYAVDQDHYINEGRIWQEGVPFDIPYGVITPKSSECENLLVPVCASASAVAFCTIRLEPTWMHLGEVSGMAAALSLDAGVNVQNIEISEIQAMIAKTGIPLEWSDTQQDAAANADKPRD